MTYYVEHKQYSSGNKIPICGTQGFKKLTHVNKFVTCQKCIKLLGWQNPYLKKHAYASYAEDKINAALMPQPTKFKVYYSVEDLEKKENMGEVTKNVNGIFNLESGRSDRDKRSQNIRSLKIEREKNEPKKKLGRMRTYACRPDCDICKARKLKY